MQVKILIGAEAAYVCIDTQFHKLDVKLDAGRSVWASLRNSAKELRHQAALLQRRSMFMEEAADLLEEDARKGRA